mgnify:CR=1 FL=1
MEKVMDKGKSMAKRQVWTSPALLVTLLLLSGCDSSPNSNNKKTGSFVGGIAGALLGNAVSDGDAVGVVIGSIIGSAVGGSIGEDVDKKNREKMAIVLEKEPSYQTSKWVDPDTGTVYVMQPAKPYTKNQRVCRPFTLTLKDPNGNGQDYVKKGTACRQEDGSWVIVN